MTKKEAIKIFEEKKYVQSGTMKQRNGFSL